MQITNMHCSGTDRYSLAAGDYRAQPVVTVGAGLAELTWQGRHLVIPHKPEEMPLAHLGKVLNPVAEPDRQRLSTSYQGQEYQLPINEHGSNSRYSRAACLARLAN